MRVRHFVVGVIAVGAMFVGAGAASGQDYPNKPIRIVCAGLGGGTDFTARLIAQGLTSSLGQQVVVDNRPSGVIPAEIVSKAQPDGYTLILSGSALWLLPFLLDKVSYSPAKDFAPITLAVTSTNILAIHPSVPAKSVKELIDYAKAKPGVLNFGTAGSGSASHLAGELFKAMAGVDIVWINYKSPGAAITDLLAGRMHLTFGSAASVKAHIDAGKLRALAVTSARPSALYPALPTIAAAGVPGYELAAPFGVFAPAGTPLAIIRRLNQEIVRAINRPDAKERFASAGLETVGSSPEALAATVKAEQAKLGKVIKDAGIRG